MRLRTLSNSRHVLAGLPGGLILSLIAACSAEDGQPNRPPVVTIATPTPDLILPWGVTLTLDATVSDDGAEPLPDADVVWSSSLDGELGTGRQLSVQGLSFGEHLITVLATDAEGLGGMASTRVVISPLHTAASWMTGHFSSAQQSLDDPTYYDITLHMARIWHGREDGLWIYVEQAVTGDAPYRQRIYRLFEAEGLVQDEIFELTNAAAWAGAWEDPSRFDPLNPSDLRLKPGCDVYFHWTVDHFEGGTEGAACPTTLNGATHATTEIVLGPARLTSWDRGWDDGDQQQWGPTAGPYLFDKLSDYPLE